MNAIVVSDLHIGSRYFSYKIFTLFLESISEDCELILNGDVIDNIYLKLDPPHLRILDFIKKISNRQNVIWVRGNHDNGFLPKAFGKVSFKPQHAMQPGVLIAHGDYFDGVMPRSRIFMKAFKKMHDLRVKLGAKPVHVAEYAKRWKAFYKLLRHNVMLNAVSYARQHGYKAVVCGHTHYAEDRMVNGIRYINTGAWTEFPAFYLLITDNEMSLKRIDRPAEQP